MATSTPTPYNRQANFTQWRAAHPNEVIDGGLLDREFDAVEQASDDTQSRLSIIQRDDGALANESVGIDQLRQDVLSQKFGVVGEWTQLTDYQAGDAVWHNRNLYKAVSDHTSSSSFQTDYQNGLWTLSLNFNQFLTVAEDSASAANAAADAALAAASDATNAKQAAQTAANNAVQAEQNVLKVAVPADNVANLNSISPAPAEGAASFATDGRKQGETAGNGSGVPVYFSNAQWRVYRDDTEVTT